MWMRIDDSGEMCSAYAMQRSWTNQSVQSTRGKSDDETGIKREESLFIADIAHTNGKLNIHYNPTKVENGCYRALGDKQTAVLCFQT